MTETDALLVLGAVGIGLLALVASRGPDAPRVSFVASPPILGALPPSAQPAPPPGWSRFRGNASALARAAASDALSHPFGTFHPFRDADGATRGVLLEWHYHDPAEGVRPVGWHKGATLYERRIA